MIAGLLTIALGFIIAIFGGLVESSKLIWVGLGIVFVGAYFAMFK